MRGFWITFFLIGATSIEAGDIDFARDVQPILSENCYACHGPDEGDRKADLRLDTREGALHVLKPGDAKASELIARITSSDGDDLMPPPEKKESLTSKQVETLEKWIESGAEWGIHWAFETPTRPQVPESNQNHPVDSFVAAKLAENELEFSQQASDEKLLRRAALDLTGLPPTLAQLDEFLSDNSPDAYKNAIDRLLASPHYGERWARWWLDAARYADSNGYEKDSVRHTWPYRDWVIDAFNANQPYDQFIIRQVGGDLLENASLSDKVATGFFRNGMVNEEGAIKAEQFRIEGIFDRMDALGKSVLGLTMQCAQCHTHKYDPIEQEEYFGMFAYLNNAHEATVPYYTKPQREKIASIDRELESIRVEVRKQNPQWEKSFAEWLDAERKRLDSGPEWEIVTPSHMGDGGQKFYPQKDGSIITKGYSPARSTERFEMTTNRKRIGSLRLELMLDPYLAYGGPGRSIDGTVAISEVKLQVGGSSEQLKPVVWESATADFESRKRETDTSKYPIKGDKPDDRSEGPISYISDGDVKTAWTNEQGPGRNNQPRVVVLNLKEPIENPKGETLHLQFEVQCQHGGWNSNDNQFRNMGRFRFSLAGEKYTAGKPLSPRVAEIVKKDRDAWSRKESGIVFDAWIANHPQIHTFAAKIESAWRKHPEPTPQLVLQEMSGDGRVTRLYERGEQTHPKQEVRPHVPRFLHDLPETGDPESRLTFAKWLVDPEAPTTARAFVNRTWAALFGTGIVESVEDLGHQSTPPSHRELLDWLSVEFVESGWDTKHLHKLIATSRAYKQDSRMRDSLTEMDPTNRLLARGPRFRPDAEVVRDIQLAASGLLDRTVGGDSVRPPIPAFLFEPPASYGLKTWEEDKAPEDRYRRALYTFRFRTVPPPFLSAFDAPSGEVSCVRRPRSTTPLQALALLNEPLSFEAAEALGSEIRKSESGLENAIAEAFRRCTSRVPEDEEIEVLRALFEQEKASGADPYLAVARALLNLDETITKS